MKELEFICRLTEYENEAELSEADRKLLKEAREAMKAAYAPYSHFKVGAAVLLENGKTVKGNNQENASYPVGLCAERVAVFAAGANYPGVAPIAIAITASSTDFSVDSPVPPCGACRQALAEYEHLSGKPIRLILAGASGKVRIAESVDSLLPFQFNASDLRRL